MFYMCWERRCYTRSHSDGGIWAKLKGRETFFYGEKNEWKDISESKMIESMGYKNDLFSYRETWFLREKLKLK